MQIDIVKGIPTHIEHQKGPGELLGQRVGALALTRGFGGGRLGLRVGGIRLDLRRLERRLLLGEGLAQFGDDGLLVDGILVVIGQQNDHDDEEGGHRPGDDIEHRKIEDVDLATPPPHGADSSDSSDSTNRAMAL